MRKKCRRLANFSISDPTIEQKVMESKMLRERNPAKNGQRRCPRRDAGGLKKTKSFLPQQVTSTRARDLREGGSIQPAQRKGKKQAKGLGSHGERCKNISREGSHSKESRTTDKEKTRGRPGNRLLPTFS